VRGPGGDGSEDLPGHSMQDTADLLGCSKASVSMDIKIADAIDALPDAFEDAKTKHDAMKTMQKLSEKLIRAELAKRIEEKRSSSPKLSLLESFIIGDCFDLFKQVPDNSINIIEVDPPYAIKLIEQKKNYGYDEEYNEISYEKYPDFLRRLFTECYRVMANNSWIICWFGHEPWFETVYSMMKEAGFEGTRMVGMWKKSTGQNQQPQYNLTNVTEMFFYMRKGRPSMANPGHNNVFEYSSIIAANKVHPTERPIELMMEILGCFASPGFRLLVPCCGSGNSLIAGYQLGLTPLGFELGKGYKDSFLVKVHKM
jgi:DNA modification methylase